MEGVKGSFIFGVLVRIDFPYGNICGDDLCPENCRTADLNHVLEKIINVFVHLMHRERVSLNDVKRQFHDVERKIKDDKEFLYYLVSFRCSFNQVHVQHFIKHY